MRIFRGSPEPSGEPTGIPGVVDGTEVVTDGTVVFVDGTEVVTDGTVVFVDGTEVVTDGTVRRNVFEITVPSYVSVEAIVAVTVHEPELV
jgi:hypothetical protein